MNTLNQEPEKIVSQFIQSYAKGDLTVIQSLLDENLVAYITNAKGGVDKVVGRDKYMKRIEATDISSTQLTLDIKQLVSVSLQQILVMVEVNVKRGGDTLQNFAAHLIKIVNKKITEMWMVEAHPAESDQFWLSKSHENK